MAFTNALAGSWGLASFANLLDWTTGGNPAVPIAATAVWAPEFFIDPADSTLCVYVVAARPTITPQY